MLKKCPILSSAVYKLISACWNTFSVPTCWKRGFTVLLYKKNDAEDSSNFRLISLLPELYKLFASVLKERLFKCVDQNNFIDNNVQKDFWPGVDGVTEHSQLLTPMFKDAKCHQRSLVVTLLDLRHAF